MRDPLNVRDVSTSHNTEAHVSKPSPAKTAVTDGTSLHAGIQTQNSVKGSAAKAQQYTGLMNEHDDVYTAARTGQADSASSEDKLLPYRCRSRNSTKSSSTKSVCSSTKSVSSCERATVNSNNDVCKTDERNTDLPVATSVKKKKIRSVSTKRAKRSSSVSSLDAQHKACATDDSGVSFTNKIDSSHCYGNQKHPKSPSFVETYVEWVVKKANAQKMYADFGSTSDDTQGSSQKVTSRSLKTRKRGRYQPTSSTHTSDSVSGAHVHKQIPDVSPGRKRPTFNVSNRELRNLYDVSFSATSAPLHTGKHTC